MHATKNTLDHNIRGQSIQLLQSALSAAVDLTAQTKQAHWNVRGPSFIALHELFDRLHGEMGDHADTLAERLVALGGEALGTVQVVSGTTGLSPYPLEASGADDHIAALGSAYAEFGKALVDGIKEADSIGDPVTSDVFTGIAREIDKSLWFIQAHETQSNSVN